MANNKAAQRRAAKNAKRKNKPKMDAKTRRYTHIQKAVSDVFNRLYFTGSSTTRGVTTHNLKRLGALLDSKDFLIGESVLNDKLRTEEITWYFWIGVFSDDGDEVWCDPLLAQSAECTVKDFDEIITPMIQQHVENVIDFQKEEFGENHTKGYGWVATPTYRCDLEASEEAFVTYFINRDVCNEEKRKELVAEYHEKQETVSDVLFGDKEEFLMEAERQYTKLKRMAKKHPDAFNKAVSGMDETVIDAVAVAQA